MTSRSAVLLAFLALIAVLPALLPGAEGYLDNGPHVVELQALARDALARGAWPAWTDQAELGTAAGELNAPLFWAPLSALVLAGLPAASAWKLAIAASNLGFAWGALRLGRHLFRDERAAVAGAALALAAPADLYGLAGAAGGMVPFRLFSGLFLGYALDRRLERAPALALWLAALLLGHTFVGVVGLLWVLLGAAWGGLPALRRALPGLLLAAGITAFYWAPLLALGPLPFAARAPDPLLADRAALLGFALGDLDLAAALWGVYRPLGGALGALSTGVMVLGLVGLRWTRPGLDRAGGRRLLVFGLLVIGLIVGGGALLNAGPLGPNPWRYLSFPRQLLLLCAGAGLCRLPAPFALAPALLAATVGWREVPTRWRQDAAPLWSSLDATWEILRAAHPAGRVYVDDTMFDPDAPAALAGSHATILGAGELRTVGCWYGVNALWTWDHTTSEGARIFGEPIRSGGLKKPPEREAIRGDSPRGLTIQDRHEPTSPPEGEPRKETSAGNTSRQARVGEAPDRASDAAWLRRRLDRYGIRGVLTASEAAAARFRAVPGVRALGGASPFAAFVIDEPAPAPVRVEGQVRVLDQRSGSIIAEVQVSGPQDFIAERGWHPGWRARLDGRRVALRRDEASGLVGGTLSRSGTLTLRWEPSGRAGWLVSGLSLLVLVVFGRRSAVPEAW